MSGAVTSEAMVRMTGVTGETVPAPQRVEVKFCGLCCLGDVAAFNELLPEYAGFVFWPKSKRNVSADQAQELRAALDERINTVGVFVDAGPEFIAGLYERGVIDVAQLHGEEDAACIDALREAAPGLCIWKAFEVKGPASIEAANASSADFVLLDAGKGSGEVFDWGLLQGVTRPYALAGGLDAGNAASALAKCTPVLLDVSSGIEASAELADAAKLTVAESTAANGAVAALRKDPAKMAAFLRAARGDPSAWPRHAGSDVPANKNIVH